MNRNSHKKGDCTLGARHDLLHQKDAGLRGNSRNCTVELIAIANNPSLAPIDNGLHILNTTRFDDARIVHQIAQSSNVANMCLPDFRVSYALALADFVEAFLGHDPFGNAVAV